MIYHCAMNEQQFAAQTIGQVYNGDAWYGSSVSAILEGVTAEQAGQRVIPNAHSIYELVEHISVWQEFFVLKLKGETVNDVPDDQNFPSPEGLTEEKWQKALARLSSTTAQLVKAINGFDEKGWERIVPGRKYKFRYILHGMSQHAAYHAGQIALLKKALPS
jgi:uncharacterized damage-inducible protein DinB